MHNVTDRNIAADRDQEEKYQIYILISCWTTMKCFYLITLYDNYIFWKPYVRETFLSLFTGWSLLVIKLLLLSNWVSVRYIMLWYWFGPPNLYTSSHHNLSDSVRSLSLAMELVEFWFILRVQMYISSKKKRNKIRSLIHYH